MSLSKNNFGNLGTAALGNPISLTHLDLSGNNIDEDGIEILSVRNLNSLTSLNLSYNPEIGSDGLNNVLPAASKKFTSLSYLDLSGNELGDDSVFSELTIFTTLTSLNLSDNQINDVSELMNLTNLTYLNLSGNQINDDGAKMLATKLRNCNIVG